MSQALSIIWSIMLILLICGTVFVILSSNSDAGKKDEHHSEAGGQEDAKVPSETVESQEPKLTDFVAAFRKTEESKPEPEKQEKPLPKLDGQPLAGILGVINTMDMSNISSNTTGQNNG